MLKNVYAFAILLLLLLKLFSYLHQDENKFLAMCKTQFYVVAATKKNCADVFK